ncbi:biodegradative arginine decarboxylase [bacterium BMS3Abin01]|nr:biodegradative arginine decarboxylase [bacterium BMS3Abin01]
MEPANITWPVLIISAQFNAENDEGFRLRELEKELVEIHDFSVIPSFSYEDGYEVCRSRSDFGCMVVDWDIPEETGGGGGRAAGKRGAKAMNAAELVDRLRRRHSHVPVLLLTSRSGLEGIPAATLERVDGCLWKTADTVQFLAGRVKMHLDGYVAAVLPPFFGELAKYAREYKYAWHTPGHMGGAGFLRSPAGVAMFKFYGENVFRADLSISVPELGSLLDHSGVTGDAERNSARVFGADHTYYVLNGTSTANQIIWRSALIGDEIAFVDRNCHKSLNYSMVITGAFPVYMIPRRNKRGIIGPVKLAEFSPGFIKQRIRENRLIPEDLKRNRVKMSALTNSTYDGICYNVTAIKRQLEKSVENLHFDEAWYAYARFHPIYRNHYGMADEPLDPDHPPVYCSQSTHKLLTAFSQASMIHIKDGGKVRIDPDRFNESYMMHGSTSPQYSMIASLDVATRMMEDNGGVMMDDIIREAIDLRKKVIDIGKELRKRRKSEWFFGMWQPKKVRFKGKAVAFEDVDTDYLAANQEPWVFSKSNNWHGFGDIEPGFVMLDPIKLTFTTPGIDERGRMAAEGIPASVVTNYLIDHGIVCEKTDYYSFLLLNSLGTTEAKQGTLLSELLSFKRLYDENRPLSEVRPGLVETWPRRYGGVGLKDHCRSIHEYFREHDILEKMQQAFEVIPDQAMKPADAYHQVVGKNVEYVDLDEMMGRTPAVMMVPYPPGIPIMMGGEVMNRKARPIFDYLRLRQDFENRFPGYESDIHGVERYKRGDGKYFKTLCVKKP